MQIGAVELHPWNASVDDIEHADRLVFDLDPGAGIAWTFVIDAALCSFAICSNKKGWNHCRRRLAARAFI